jgi:putative transposon-encoded protein
MVGHNLYPQSPSKAEHSAKVKKMLETGAYVITADIHTEMVMSKQDWKIDTIAFEYIERKCGTSSHIILPTPMVGKRVRVIVETLD